MAPDIMETVSNLLGTAPQQVDAARVSCMARPRTYWASLGPANLSDTTVDPALVLKQGWRPLWERMDIRPVHPLGHKWSTLTRPFPAGSPAELPANFPRHALRAYTERHLAYFPDAPETWLARIDRLLAESIRLPSRIVSKDLYVKDSEAVRLRSQTPIEIHTKGLDAVLRPLSADEVEKALGYPPGASDAPDSDDWQRLRHLGNGFSVQVVAALLEPFTQAVLSNKAPAIIGRGPSATTKEDAIASLSQGARGRGVPTSTERQATPHQPSTRPRQCRWTL